ncbi:MAG TPA: K+/H+ antiporter subunit F [Steroidobacteraceae bacterium]|nr:K+/H+ antiporter subunit F [Steroidobacteraceae bacterium]
MIEVATTIAGIVFGIAVLLNVYRLIRGPHALDRILALDTLYVNTIALILLLGIAESSAAYFEAALLIAAVGFIGTAALAKYVGSGRVIE